MTETQQIYYTDWAEKLAPGHENYWWMIGTIADWLGYALEGSRHGFRSEPYFLSAVAVRQTKEKFGGVRCYCSLANPWGVKKKYDREVETLLAQNDLYFKWKGGELDPESNEYPRPWTIKTYEEGFPKSIPTLEEFTEVQRLKDAQWYRQVYQDAIKLWPQYERAIAGAADYWEYLFKTEEELDTYFDGQVAETRRLAAKLNWSDLPDRLAREKNQRQFAKRVSGFI